METEFQKAIGKNAGEIRRDIADFLQLSFPIGNNDLATLAADLNMQEQFSFALLMEAQTQGWDTVAAENFYGRICAPFLNPAVSSEMISAFRRKEGDAFAKLSRKYGNRFTLGDGSYWATCLSLGIDRREAGKVLQYLQLFTVCLMEFAYMENRRPESTYTWGYYESFRDILEKLTDDGKEPSPIAVRAVGGTAGVREGNSYQLTLGIDLENPNPDRMAWGVQINVVLKDADGKEITKFSDQISCMDPSAVFHYGISRKITGASVAGITASAKAEIFTKLDTPVMKGIRLSDISVTKEGDGQVLHGTLTNHYPVPLNGFAIYYQYLNQENKVLGGSSEWYFQEIPAGSTVALDSLMNVNIKSAAKVVYSIDFDVKDLENKTSHES